MFWVYVIKNNETDKIYIGQTQDVERRLRFHNEIKPGKRAYTNLNKGIWRLVYKEEFETRSEALAREKQLKSSRGRDFIHNQVMGR